MAIGRAGSYLTDAPVREDYIGNAMLTAENQGFRYREERRKIADAKKADIEKEEQKEKEIAEHLKNYKIDLVGQKSIDDLTQSFAYDSFNEYTDLARKLSTTSDKQERLRLRTEQARLDQNFNTLKQIPGILKEKVDFITKNIKDLNPDDVDIIQEKLGQLEKGQAKLYLDKYKVPHISIYKTDKDGKVLDILEKEQPLAEFINSITPHFKSNYQSLLTDAIKNTGVATTSTEKGLTTIKTVGVNKDLANQKADLFADVIANNPDEAYAIAKAKGINVDDKKAIKEVARQDFLNGLDKSYEQSYDAELAFRKERARKEDKEKEIVISTASTIQNNGEKDGVNLQKGAKDFPLGNVIIKSGDGKEQKATNVYVNPGGKMFLRVEQSGFQGASRKNTQLTEAGQKRKAQEEKAGKKFEAKYDEIVDITETDKTPKVVMLDFGKDQNEIGRYALRMGYKGAKELQDDFIQRSGGDEFIITPDERGGNKPKAKEEDLRKKYNY